MLFPSLGDSTSPRFPFPDGWAMKNFLQDVRFSARLLAKRPGLTATVLISLMLGIGANSLIFSAVSTVLLHALPFKDADRLVILWDTNPQL